MPYNFETTFVTPLLADMDNGRIGSSKDLANAITKYYINTIKQGLPQNVPPTLPAPGLNPIAPPPYPIGASPYNTADSRRLVFYNIVFNYLSAKDKFAKKETLVSLLRTIRFLRTKIRNTRRQITNLTQRAKIISTEIATLPNLIKELSVELRSISVNEIRGLDQLQAIIEELSVSRPQDGLNVFFARELELIGRVRSLQITNFQDVLDIATFVENTSRQINARTRNTDDVIRNYIFNKIAGVVAFQFRLAQALVDPFTNIDFLKFLLRNSPSGLILFNRIINIETVTKPLLIRVNNRIQAKKNEIQNELQKKLKNKIEEQKALATSRPQKKSSIYKRLPQEKAKKQKERTAKIKKLKDKAKNIVKLGGLITVLTNEVLTLQKDIQNEFKTFGESIPKGTLTSAEKEIAVAQLEQYLKKYGLFAFFPFALQALNQATCKFVTFQEFFEKKSIKYQTYARRLATIERSLRELKATIRELATGEATLAQKSTIPLRRNVNFQEILTYLVGLLEKDLSEVENDLNNQKEANQAEQAQTIEKSKKDLENEIESGTPTNSKVDDKKNKAEETRQKAADKRLKVQRLRKNIAKARALAGIIKGGVGLTANIAQGNYNYTDNQTNINTVIRGISQLKQQQGFPPSQIQQEEQNLLKGFQYLLAIENLSKVLPLVLEDLGNEGFKRELIALKQTTVNVATIDAIQQIVNNPPTNFQSFIDVANQLTLAGVEDGVTLNRLVSIERKYVRRAAILLRSAASGLGSIGNRELENDFVFLATCLEKQQSLILAILRLIVKYIKAFGTFLKEKINNLISAESNKLEAEKGDIQKQSESSAEAYKFKTTSGLETLLFSLMLGLAARTFWTGATWTGPTGSTHTTLSIGPFRRIRAKPIDGPSKFVSDMGKGFARQLANMVGLITPPPNTLIPPIPFRGYK